MEALKLLEKIDSLNSEVKRINTENQKNQGKLEQLLYQRDSALAAYNQSYHTKLTPDRLGDELNALYAVKEQEVANLENALALISEGKYAEAEAAMNTLIIEPHVAEAAVNPAPTVKAEPEKAVEPTVSVSVPDPIEPNAPTEPAAPAPKASAPAAPSAPTAPKAPSAPVAPSAPSAPVAPAESEDDTPQLAPPPIVNSTGGVGMPSAPTQASAKSRVVSFDDILKGSNFGNN